MRRRRRPGRVRAGRFRLLPHALAAIGPAVAALPAQAGELPPSAFQVYNPANASTIQPSPFALFTVPVDQIRPTQMNEGFFEIGRKTAGWDLLSPAQLQAALPTNIEPVVIGPGGVLYLTDGHHTFTSLLNSIYGPSNPSVYVDVIANYSNLTTAQFWTQMQASNFLLPINNGVPQTVDPTTGAPIPTSLQGLTNDPYRGLEYGILKQKDAVLFPTAANITGVVGSSKPGLDKVTGFYSDFIWANAYRSANNGLGLPYLTPGDIAIATQWNLNPASVTREPNIPGTITVSQLPGFILPGSITITGTISDATLANGTLDGSKTGTFDQSSTFASFNGITSITNGTVTIGTPRIGLVLQTGSDLGGTVTLTGANTYTGGTTIIAGTLSVNGDAALGAAAPVNATIDPNNIAASVHAANGIIFNSLSEGAGTLVTTSSFATNRPIAVDGEVATLAPSSGTTLTLDGQIASLGAAGTGVANTSGVADLTINGSGTVVVAPTSGSNPLFFGNWIISKGTLSVASDAALGNTAGPSYTIGSIDLDGGTFKPTASFNSVRSLEVTSKSTFDTNGTTTSFAGTLTDDQRNLTVTNSASGTAGAVTFGSLEIGGALELTVDKGAGTGTTVTFANGITRDPNAVLLIAAASGSTLGSTAKVLSSGASTTLTNNIVQPWIITDAGGNNPYDFATYGSTNGYTALAAANYTTNIASSTASTVDKLSGTVNVGTNAAVAAYAVNVQRASTINGAGSTLTIGDGINPAGLILNGTNGNPITLNVSTIAFRGSEGIIYVAGSQTSAIANVVNSQITGSGGLTLSGVGMLTLKTATAETGTIVVDSGTLNLAAANALSSSTGGVLLANTKNLATANLAMNQSQSLSALNSAGNNSFIVIDSTGTNGGSTATRLTIGDGQNLSSTISSTIVQNAATFDTTTSLATSGTAVAGVITKNGTGLLDLSGMSKGTLDLVAGSTIVINGGDLRIASNIFVNPNAISLASGTELQFAEGGGGVFANTISGAGDVRLIGGTLKLTGTANAYSGGTFVEVGSTLDLTTANVSSGNANIIDAGGLVVFDQATTGTYNGVISDGLQMGVGPLLQGSLAKDDSTGANGGNVTLAQVQTYTGPTYVEAGTLTLGAVNAIASSSSVVLGRVGGGATATLALNADNQIAGLADNPSNTTSVVLNGHTLTLAPIANMAWSFGGSITNGSASGNLVQNGPGTSVLTGTSSYSGATAIDAGALVINGSIATSSLTSVNNGGTLAGNGTVGNTQVNAGGTFAPGTPGTPGTAMTVAGTLTFKPGGNYLVQLSPTAATQANVSGTAALGGNVLAAFAAGTYVPRQYDILHSAGLGGTTFAALGTSNLPANFTPSLSYTATDVMLDLSATMGASGGLSGNQQSVANALNSFFNNGGTLPPNFLTIFGLTGGNLANTLSQLSGEAATAGRQASFELMTSFLSLVIDPSVYGRGGGGGALGFAPESAPDFPRDVALAYNAVLKAPPRPAPLEPRWTAWGSLYGGYNHTNGDPASGTTDLMAHAEGVAAGMDYHLTPDAVAGFALAGGGTSWSLAQGLGGGSSDAFQIGAYGIDRWGPAYVAGSLAFANHWMTTDRFAVGGDHLTANFNAQSYGGRAEGGYRLAVAPATGVTPYAALQAQLFRTPSYSETDLGNGGFGLSFAAASATDTRGELGARFDQLVSLPNGLPLLLRGRVAWAHDWVSNPALAAAFQALPGASFIVNGAAPPKNSALASAGAELRITPAVSFAARFEGDLANSAQTYSGIATLRYAF
jgi:autotransporter-associated beta strand protein